MSEYTQNDDVTIAENAVTKEPLINLSALIAACGRGIAAAKQLIDEERSSQSQPVTALQSVSPNRLTDSILSRPEAAIDILSSARLRLRTEEAVALLPRLAEAVRTRQPEVLADAARLAAGAHQIAMARVVLDHACNSARFAGATEIQVDPARGYLLARVPGTTARLRVDVGRLENGSVNHQLDLDGFHGDSCQPFREAYVGAMENSGISLARPVVRIRKNHAIRATAAMNRQGQGGNR